MASVGQNLFDEMVRRRHRQQDLAGPFRAVDDQDWDYLIGCLGDGGRGRFWKAIFAELRPLLDQTK